MAPFFDSPIGFSPLAWWFALAATAAVAAVLSFVWIFMRAQRRRAYYVSGEQNLVERAIAEELGASSSPRRFRSLALCALGDLNAIRRSLLSPGDGALDEDRELELCARIVTEAFDGRRDEALKLCHQLVAVPMQSRGEDGQRREARRAGVVAIARSVAGSADHVDLEDLARAPTFEPSLYWACRYSAALSCCLREDAILAHSLVAEAPDWPQESVFRRIQEKIVALATEARNFSPQAA